MDEREQKLWNRIRAERAAYGVPQAICSAITPFPVWVMAASIIVFIPLALILAFFIKRHTILVQGGELVVLDLSFYRYRIERQRFSAPLGTAASEYDGNTLTIEGRRFYLEPGWRASADRIVELDRGVPS